LRRKGTRTPRTAAILAAVEFLAANLPKSASRLRKVAHSGSRELGCGIVRAVSAVDWEASSDEVPASEVQVEAVWEESRRNREWLRLCSVIFSAAGVVVVVPVVALGGAASDVASDGEAALSGSMVFAAARDEAERDVEDALLTNTLCGFCLILVKYTLARLSARPVLLSESADRLASRSRLPSARGRGLPSFRAPASGDAVLDVFVLDFLLLAGRPRSGEVLPLGLLLGDGDREGDIHDRLANPAKDSTVLDLSIGFGSDFSSNLELLSLPGPPLSLTDGPGASGFTDFRTSGEDLELGSHRRGLSIMDLLRLRASTLGSSGCCSAPVVLISTTFFFFFCCCCSAGGGLLRLVSSLPSRLKEA